MHLRAAVLFFLMLSLLMLSACSKEASAKRKLNKLNIDVSTASLLEQTEKGNIEAVGMLLTAGIDPAEDSTGVSALTLAVRGNRKAIVQLFLSKGVDIKATDRKGWTPLMHGIESGAIKEIIQLLIENGADVNVGPDSNKPLMLAVRGGSIDIAKLLIDKGADINAKTNSGETPLIAAAAVGHVEIIKLLIAKGSDVNVRDNNDITPLINAAIEGNAAVAQELLNNGADLFARDKDGLSASMIAAIRGNIDIVRLLKKAGATEPLEDTIFADLLGKARSDPLIKRFMDTAHDWQTSMYGHGVTFFEKSKSEGISLYFKQDRLTAISLYSSAWNTNKYNLYQKTFVPSYKQFAKPLPYDISFSDVNEDIYRKIGHRPDNVRISDVFYRSEESYFLKWYKLGVEYDTESKNIIDIGLQEPKK